MNPELISRDVRDYEYVIVAACRSVVGGAETLLLSHALALDFCDVLQEARWKAHKVLENYTARGKPPNVVVYVSVQNFCFNLLRDCGRKGRLQLNSSYVLDKDDYHQLCVESPDDPTHRVEIRDLLQRLRSHRSVNVRKVLLWRLGEAPRPPLTRSQMYDANRYIRQVLSHD